MAPQSAALGEPRCANPRIQSSRRPMLAPLDTLDHLKARLGEHAGEVARDARSGFVSLTLELPEVPTHAPRLTGPRFQFLHAHREEIRAGYGIAGEWLVGGPDRLSELRKAARRLTGSWRHLDPDETGLSGFALLGLAARPGASGQSGLPNAMLWLPEAALRTHRGQAALILTARLPSAADRLHARWSALLDRLVPQLFVPAPAPLSPAQLRASEQTPWADEWQSLVGATLDEIAAGRLEKVVLARRLGIEGSRRFDVARLVAALGFFFPSCQVVDIRRGDTSFVAATPERLLSLKGNRLETDALAGTASRAAESDGDKALADALRRSPKNLHEHRLVVQAICGALDGQASEIKAAREPDLMRLNNAQHLWTRITATADEGADLFSLAERLYPTPATNGAPRQHASDWLHRHDPFERGWYTGLAGTIEPDLGGELWVLLRCAEIRERTARLYAGAGIVAGSDAAMEWRETEHKLSAMLTALKLA